MPDPRPGRANLFIPDASSLLLGSINKADNCSNASARSLAAAILPDFGIGWNLDVIRGATSGRINELIPKLRNSPLPKLHYDKLPGLFWTASPAPYSLIPEWVETDSGRIHYGPDPPSTIHRRYDLFPDGPYYSGPRCLSHRGCIGYRNYGRRNAGSWAVLNTLAAIAGGVGSCFFERTPSPARNGFAG